MEQYAASLKARFLHDPSGRRLLRAVICLGALSAAAVLTLETRIGVGPGRSSALPVTPRASAASPAGSVPSNRASVEMQAKATAHKALAEALVRAKMDGPPIGAGSDRPPPAAAAVPSPRAAGPALPTTGSPHQLTEADFKLLAAKAAEALKAGDIGGARMVLERAAAGGDPTAVFALGETYDPNVLTKMHVRGLEGDVARARELYLRASRQGVEPAKQRLDDLATDTASVD